MSKLLSLIIALALAALLGAGGALVAAQSGAGAAAGRKTATTAAEVEATTGELLMKVSELRGLKVLRPVKSGVKSRAEIEQTVVRAFDESSTPEEIETSRKTMTAFGLLPKDFAFREFMVRLLTEQVAGFYEPKTKEFFLADWNSIEAQKMVMAHELTHVLQDQHFDLRRFEKWPDGDGDREMAIHALIEGDATALMVEYTIKPFGLDVTRLPLSALKDMSSQTGGQAGGRLRPPRDPRGADFPLRSRPDLRAVGHQGARLGGRLPRLRRTARLDRAGHAPAQVPRARKAREGRTR
jgi:hypothetical protein